MVHTIKGHTPKIHENVFVAWNAEVTGQVTIAAANLMSNLRLS